MALEVIHTDVKERMWELFVAFEREAYANGFDLRHYRQDVLKKRMLDGFKIHEYTEDEYLEKIGNNAWIYNYILQRAYQPNAMVPSIDVPTIFQNYSALYAEEMYDTWFKSFLNETYV
jgi:hypothetical protein